MSQPKPRRPVAYLQCCHNLAWLALDDVANAITGPKLTEPERATLRALDAVSALGDHGFDGASPEEYVQAARDLLNLAAADALDGVPKRKLAARKRLAARVDAALTALGRGGV